MEPAGLKRLPFFRGLPRWALARLTQAAQEEELPADRTVLHQHDRTRTVHLLLAGVLQIYVPVGDDDLLVAVLGDPGELITFRPPYRATASVRCEQPSRLISCRSRPGPGTRQFQPAPLERPARSSSAPTSKPTASCTPSTTITYKYPRTSRW